MRPIANITVAIATCDRPDALVRCLDALLVGDTVPREIVIVDQSRTDETQACVAQRAHSGSDIIYVRQERRGLSASRNAAIVRMTTPVLAVTDDDCVPSAGWITAIERAFSQPEAPDVVTGRVLPFGPDVPGRYAVSTRSSTVRATFRGPTEPWLVGTGGNVAVTSEWIERVGRYDERLGVGSPGRAGEDMDMLYRLLRAGARVRYEPDALIYHERQSKARRLASRTGYGLGMGVFCGVWMGQRDSFAKGILGRWFFNHTLALAGALRRREWMRAYEESLMLRGTVSGLLYGLRIQDISG